jgi:GNAT superfamily N-acetyltransferase
VSGSRDDYHALARFHYVARSPATFAHVVAARYRDPLRGPRTVGVAVLSYPVPGVPAFCRRFGFGRLQRGRAIRFANRNIRTVSRVIVHPQFRSAGVASRLLARLVRDAPTRFLDAVAAMGSAHPLFERAGFRRLNADHPDERPYFLLDRRRTPNLP